MFRLGSALVKTCAKISNMTVATADATMVIRAVKKARMSIGRERSQTKVRRRCGGRPAGVICVPFSPVLAAAQSLIVCGGREETASGLMKIMMKLRTAAAMNRPNIQ